MFALYELVRMRSKDRRAHVILKLISRQKTHTSRVNWREVEFAAIYTSKALTIDTREIAREWARGYHTSFVRAFELAGANYFLRAIARNYASSRNHALNLIETGGAPCFHNAHCGIVKNGRLLRIQDLRLYKGTTL